MLMEVAKALTDLAMTGRTVIVNNAHNGTYADEVLHYVIEVIRGMKCDYETLNVFEDIIVEILP